LAFGSATYVMALSQLTAWLAVYGSSLRVHLFQNAWTFDPATTLADLIESAFGGYAVVTPTMTSAALNPSNQAQSDSSLVTFSWSSGADATVYGWYLTDSMNVLLFDGATFPSPIVLNALNPDLPFQFSLLDSAA
jgi:hypothetical protein